MYTNPEFVIRQAKFGLNLASFHNRQGTGRLWQPSKCVVSASTDPPEPVKSDARSLHREIEPISETTLTVFALYAKRVTSR